MSTSNFASPRFAEPHVDTGLLQLPRRWRVALSLACGMLALLAVVLLASTSMDGAVSGLAFRTFFVLVIATLGLVGIHWRALPGTASVLVAITPAAK